MCRISIVMPVYNREEYLKDAIDSILNQTFFDFEFLIIDDGSTDNSKNIIKEYQKSDNRIKCYFFNKNIGYAKRLNFGIKKSIGEYIARMDADDISLPNRLKLQFEYMEKHREVGICGGAIFVFNNQGEKYIHRYPILHKDILAYLLFEPCFAHPTVIFRKKIIQKHSLFYNEQLSPAEDYDLWVRASELCELGNVSDVVLKYRQHEMQESMKNKSKQLNNANIIRMKQVSKLGIQLAKYEKAVYESFCIYQIDNNTNFYVLIKILFRIMKKNIYFKKYRTYILFKILFKKFFLYFVQNLIIKIKHTK